MGSNPTGGTLSYPGVDGQRAIVAEHPGGLCTQALDLLGIAWRPNGPWRISVNRRSAVALLDEHVGPKH